MLCAHGLGFDLRNSKALRTREVLTRWSDPREPRVGRRATYGFQGTDEEPFFVGDVRLEVVLQEMGERLNSYEGERGR